MDSKKFKIPLIKNLFIKFKESLKKYKFKWIKLAVQKKLIKPPAWFENNYNKFYSRKVLYLCVNCILCKVYKMPRCSHKIKVPFFSNYITF